MDIDINDEWETFFQQNDIENEYDPSLDKCDFNENSSLNISDLYISTTTSICHLNTTIDIYNVFWKIPVMSYYSPKNGVVKKEMKFGIIY